MVFPVGKVTNVPRPANVGCTGLVGLQGSIVQTDEKWNGAVGGFFVEGCLNLFLNPFAVDRVLRENE